MKNLTSKRADEKLNALCDGKAVIELIYVTGDTHIPIDIAKLNTKNFPDGKNLNKDDFVIICGDFGGVWNGGSEDKYWLKWLHGKNFTTLFVDGNHENHHLLSEYPVEDFCGGKIHRINDSVYHLMRGEVYVIDGSKIFTMGGASSHDRQYRKENISWWAEELPSNEEYDNAVRNLTAHDWSVDYIFSHCCPDSIQYRLKSSYAQDGLTYFFEKVIKADCAYNRWYFGHYHEDIEVDEKHICVYQRVIKLD